MKKFSEYSPKVESLDLSHLLEEHLHVGINGPIDPVLVGTISIEGKEELTESMKNYMDCVFKNKLRILLEEAKTKAAAGDLRWFDEKIKSTYDSI